MGNSNLYLSLISAAGMILVAVAAVAIWRQKTKLSCGRFFLRATLDTAFIWLVELAFFPFALVTISILCWCRSQFGGPRTEQVLEPEAVIAN